MTIQTFHQPNIHINILEGKTEYLIPLPSKSVRQNQAFPHILPDPRPKNTSFIHGRLGHQVGTWAEALFYSLPIYYLLQGMLLRVCQEALENMPNLPDL